MTIIKGFNLLFEKFNEPVKYTYTSIKLCMHAKRLEVSSNVSVIQQILNSDL